jgi:hypothetical protein
VVTNDILQCKILFKNGHRAPPSDSVAMPNEIVPGQVHLPPFGGGWVELRALIKPCSDVTSYKVPIVKKSKSEKVSSCRTRREGQFRR